MCNPAFARVIAFCLLTAGWTDLAQSQPNPNPPKVQKALETAARATTREIVGPVIRTGATVGDHLLVINYEPAPGADPSAALRTLNETDWNRSICGNKDALAFLYQNGVSTRITFTEPEHPPTTIADITSQSCAQKQAAGAQVSRIIEGISFAPKPTQQEALARVQEYLRTSLKDPDSALVKCGGVGDAAWVKPVLQGRKYGYFISCDINGKNSYGGYVGYETYLFRLNGTEFEYVYQTLDKAGLMEQSK